MEINVIFINTCVLQINKHSNIFEKEFDRNFIFRYNISNRIVNCMLDSNLPARIAKYNENVV